MTRPRRLAPTKTENVVCRLEASEYETLKASASAQQMTISDYVRSRLARSTMTPPPAPFEALRQYATDAIEHLLHDMADQAVHYAVPADDVLALLGAIAQARHKSIWDVYLDWVYRHGMPALTWMETACTRPLDPEETLALRARLRDLFGYALLGLVLTEKDKNFT